MRILLSLWYFYWFNMSAHQPESNTNYFIGGGQAKIYKIRKKHCFKYLLSLLNCMFSHFTVV